MKDLLLAIRREFLMALHDPRRLVFLFGAAVAYLASREAGYVTGQTLHVNGGMAMI